MIRVVHVTAEGVGIVEVRNELEAMHALVGGWLEAIRFCSDWTLIVNEEAALDRPVVLPVRFVLNGEAIRGDCFVTRAQGDEFVSLSEGEALYVADMLCSAHGGGEIVSVLDVQLPGWLGMVAREWTEVRKPGGVS